MDSTLRKLIKNLDSSAIAGTDVIPWACPVPVFGDLSSARVATLGLNPSKREFLDKSGQELPEVSRRLHTLGSLGLGSWSEADSRCQDMILESCRGYFLGKPFGWFEKLDEVVAGTKTSYYCVSHKACHLDLVPFATDPVWSKLKSKHRSALLAVAGDTLGLLLRDSPVRVLILNGGGVVRQFQKIAGTDLKKLEMPSWALLWKSGVRKGFGYRGVVDTLSGIELGHKILVLGFSHNRQSTPGMTTEVVHAIRDWIAQASEDAPR